MNNKKYESVWEAIEDTKANPENMKIRSSLMIAITTHISKQGWTQKEAAAHLGVTQPRISDLIRGKINVFAIDALVNMLSSIGMHVEMKVHKAA